MAELPSVEETDVSVASHDPGWAGSYESEAARVRAVFGDRCAAIEHIGSTAVAGLLAKPIVDILVGSADGTRPTENELQALVAEGYVFLGEDGRRPGRWFWRKRRDAKFNLSLVPVSSDLWHDNLAIRDYLRSHPAQVAQYAEVKRRAVVASPNSLLGYQNYKREFVTGLRARALEWRQSYGRPAK